MEHWIDRLREEKQHREYLEHKHNIELFREYLSSYTDKVIVKHSKEHTELLERKRELNINTNLKSLIYRCGYRIIKVTKDSFIIKN